jgi:hypothetical protein
MLDKSTGIDEQGAPADNEIDGSGKKLAAGWLATRHG